MQLGSLFKEREWAHLVQGLVQTDVRNTGFDIRKESADFAEPYINN